MMKKRVICLFVSFLVLLGPFPVYAQSFSFSDLSEFGVPALETSRFSASKCDGVISHGEYGSGACFRKDRGLYLLKNNLLSEGAAPSALTKQESYVNLSGEYIYCALRLETDRAFTPIEKDFGSCYCVSIGIGLSNVDHPVLCGSQLSNTYYFSSADFSCISFCGERIARSVDEKAVSSKPLSSTIEQYRENGVTASDGICWNADEYCKNAVFSITKNGSLFVLTLEVKIPLDDALLSVHSSHRDEVRSVLRNNAQTHCGSFTSEIALNSDSILVTGIPASLGASFLSDGETLSDWMISDFPKPLSGVYVPSVIPVPLYWCGKYTVKTETVTQQTQEKPSDETGSVQAPSYTVSTEINTENQDVTDTVTQESESEKDESVFENLPDSDTLLPEETEILYDTKSATTKDDGKEDSFASSLMATLSGVLIFASVVILCIYFRDSSIKEEPKKKKRKKKQTDKLSDKKK